jgi:hypothetical protein
MVSAMKEGRSRAILTGKWLPADRADALARFQAAIGEDVAKRFRPVARLAGQAEGLVEDRLVRAGAEFGVTPAFIADQEFRRAARQDDKQRFLEAWIIARQIGDIGGMLAVAIDHESVDARLRAEREQGVYARQVGRGRNFGHDGRLAELGQHDLLQDDR